MAIVVMWSLFYLIMKFNQKTVIIAHIAKTRNVRAGSIVGSGTVSNKDWSKGYSCIAEKRCIETIEDGRPSTEFMKYGDTIRIEMKGRDGQSLFGAIDQQIVSHG